MCLIVSQEDVVITMYRVPGWFKKAYRYSGKERIRNQAKYEKFNRVYGSCRRCMRTAV